MSSKLYVGNLSFDVTENDLRDMLSQHGPVNEINVIMDKMTGRARGFAFATMNTEEGAKAAILALNGKDWKGGALTGGQRYEFLRGAPVQVGVSYHFDKTDPRAGLLFARGPRRRDPGRSPLLPYSSAKLTAHARELRFHSDHHP